MRPLIYLSTFFPPKQKDYFFEGMHSAANISASAFSYSLLSGLSAIAKGRLKVVNTSLTGPYPIDYKRVFTPRSNSEEYNLKVTTIGVCNLYGVQGASIRRNVYTEIKTLGVGAADILIYSIQLPLLQAAIEYKKKNPGSRIILVVPDLLEDLKKRSPIIQTIKDMLFGDFAQLCKQVDAYVLLTRQMIERMPEKRPYCVVEGIYNPSEQRQGVKKNQGQFTVLYTGMLYEKFGVKNLVDAISSIKEDKIKLQLCGNGELVEYIKEKAISDSRIEYLGIVPREIVLQLQSEASLLVNPRQPNSGFTKYSFPSKNIEYLASGTPTLLYELEGIPQEYYQYCYHLPANKNSVADLAEMIKTVFDMPNNERMQQAERAQKFIFTEKNAPSQCDKIIKFINNL